MAAPTAPTIAESAMTLLADDADEVVGPAVAVVVVPVLVLTGGVVRGLVVVVGVVAVVVVVRWVVEVVPVVPVTVPVVTEDPPELPVRQLESVEVKTVKAAVCEIAPVESRKVSPRELPAA